MYWVGVEEVNSIEDRGQQASISSLTNLTAILTEGQHNLFTYITLVE